MPTDIHPSLTAVSTGTGEELPITSFDRVGMSIQSSAGVSAGVVALEWSSTSGYSGTWANIDSITTSAASTQYMAGPFDVVSGFVRARITTTITGGTVTVLLSRSDIGHY